MRYLGFDLIWGSWAGISPQTDQQLTKMKKEVRQFLVLAGYYYKFVPNYPDITNPLTDFIKKGVSGQVQWTDTYQWAFTPGKVALCGRLHFNSPDFFLPFVEQMAASDRGLCFSK